VAPSLLSADFSRLAEELDDMERAGADLFHLDVMDAHFVPNLTFGPFIVRAIRRSTDLVLDAHLMMTDPADYLEPFAEAGADALTIHVEASSPVAETLTRIRELGLRPGLSLNPGTELAAVHPFLPLVDLVLVMTVQPGFGGQSFRENGPARIAQLDQWRRENAWHYAISVDGGINDQTAPLCRAAGADILVSGSHLFGAADRAATIARLRGEGAP
jgi:ribulose-phosphate 3-epimerase